MGVDLAQIDEHALVAELQRRGWRFRELKMPVAGGSDNGSHERYRHLLHTERVGVPTKAEPSPSGAVRRRG